MTKNPLINAIAAIVYIMLIASVMYYGGQYVGSVRSVIMPIAMVSLFTFSAAVMGYLFLMQPFLMYMDGKKKQGVNLFLQTLFAFGGMTLVIFVLLFLGIFK